MHKLSVRRKIFIVLFSMIFCLSSLEICLRIAGSTFLFLQEQRNRLSLRQKEAYRIMCIGESVTFGLTACGKDSYPAQLEEVLNEKSVGVRFSVINKGMPAAKTSFIISELEENIDKYKPDMIIAMMGINDRQDFVPYEIFGAKEKVFSLKSFRIYKLAKLLWLHVLNKCRRIGIYKIKHNSPQMINQLTRQDGPAKPYAQLAVFYHHQGRYKEAEEMFKKAIDKEPKNSGAYSQWGKCYVEQRKYLQAEEMFKKAMQIEPKNYSAYTELGWAYFSQKKYTQAEEMFKKAMEINPRNSVMDLGNFYYYQRQYPQAEELLKKAIAIYPETYYPYVILTECYSEQGKYKEAIETSKTAIEINPQDSWAYGSLALLYKEMGQTGLAEEYFRKANGLRLEYYSPITRQNYQRLKEIASRRGIKLACAQYPVRNVGPLKKMFDSQEGIIFIDNERVFKEALKTAKYEEYFSDMLGGDFGHCTKKGNRLLAENIANSILRECFKK